MENSVIDVYLFPKFQKSHIRFQFIPEKLEVKEYLTNLIGVFWGKLRVFLGQINRLCLFFSLTYTPLRPNEKSWTKGIYRVSWTGTDLPGHGSRCSDFWTDTPESPLDESDSDVLYSTISPEWTDIWHWLLDVDRH